MAAILKIYFLLLLNQQANWLETWQEAFRWLVDKKKYLKCVMIRIPRWRPSWKSIFRFFSWTERPSDLKLGGNHPGECRLKTAEIFASEIQDGRHGGHLENLFFASPEPKDQLTWNSVGSIRVTCRATRPVARQDSSPELALVNQIKK